MKLKKFSVFKLFALLVSILPLVTLGRINDPNSCLGVTSVASSYLRRRLGTDTKLVWNSNDGRDLGICRLPAGGPRMKSCCSKQHEEVFRANGLKLISRFWPKSVSGIILKQSGKIVEQINKLLEQTRDKVQYRLTNTYRVPEAEYRGALASLFSRLTIANLSESVSETAYRFDSFFIELFPSIFAHQMGRDSYSPKFRDCLKANYRKFRPKPFLNLAQAYGRKLHTVLHAFRLLLDSLRFSAELINMTTTSDLSPPCIRALVRLRLCHLCSGQNVSRPCADSCLNTHRGCFAHLLPLRSDWIDFMRGSKHLLVTITERDALILSLKRFDTTILKAAQKAMFNLASYGQQVVTHCAKPDIISRNKTSAGGSRRATARRQKAVNIEIGDPNLDMRLRLIRELLDTYEYFFSHLPDQFCKGLRTTNCWNGTQQIDDHPYSTVWKFSTHDQRSNVVVPRQAPVSFSAAEVERQRVKLRTTVRKLIVFIDHLQSTVPIVKTTPVPIAPEEKLPPRFEGSGSGSGRGPLPEYPRARINAPVDDDLVDLGSSGSGSTIERDLDRPPVDPVPAPRQPGRSYIAGSSLRPLSWAALLFLPVVVRTLIL